MKDQPIPDRTVDLVDWLRRKFPEFSPRSTDQVEASLKRGAQVELIDTIEFELSRAYDED